MRNSLLRRIMAAMLAVCCLAQPACAESIEESTESLFNDVPTEYVITDGPDANRELAFGSVCILNGCRTADSYVALGGSARRLDTAQAVFAFERSTGTLVYSYNPDVKVSPGGLAKLVNAMVVVEHIGLDEQVEITKSVNRRPAGSVHIDLKPGEIVTVSDLLHCMIMQGANDAAIALAEKVAGNQEAFVAMMNQKVRQLGCNNTEFGNSTGLDNATQTTSARDMAKILLDATRSDVLKELISCISYTVPANELHAERKFESQNYFIDSKNIQKFYDTRITGGFQSYSSAAGANIIFTGKERNMDMIFVVLGAKRDFYENGWQVKAYGNFEEGQSLFRYVFNTFKANRVLYNGQALKQFAVNGGECDVVTAPKLDLDSVLPADAHMDNLIMEYKDRGLTAPIHKDDIVATVEVWYRNTCLLEAELYAMGDVRASKDSGVEVLGGANRNTTESRMARYALIISTCVLLAVAGYLGINYLLRMRRRAKTRRRRGKTRRPRY